MVAFKADSDDGPICQALNFFTNELGTIVDKLLRVFIVHSSYIIASMKAAVFICLLLEFLV